MNFVDTSHMLDHVRDELKMRTLMCNSCMEFFDIMVFTENFH